MAVVLGRPELSRLAAALGGLPVLGCLRRSPAAEAGIRYGDILLAINGVATPTWEEFLAVRNTCKGGFTARLFRDGQEMDITITFRPGPLPSMLDVLAELNGVDEADEDLA